MALLARDLISDLLRHRRVVICVLPIKASLQSLPLRGLLLHRSVAAQLPIQRVTAEFGLVAYTVAMILVKPVGDLISLLPRERFLRLIIPHDDGCLASG